MYLCCTSYSYLFIVHCTWYARLEWRGILFHGAVQAVQPLIQDNGLIYDDI